MSEKRRSSGAIRSCRSSKPAPSPMAAVYATACTATNSFPSAPSPAASAPMSTASGACRSAPAIWLSSTRSRRMPATPSPIAVGRTSCSISIRPARRAAAGTARRRRRPFCSVQPTAQPRSGAVPRPEPALCAADGSAVLRAGKTDRHGGVFQRPAARAGRCPPAGDTGAYPTGSGGGVYRRALHPAADAGRHLPRRRASLLT